MSGVTNTTPDGFTYRDLNSNGRLDPYEDPRRPIEARIEDLLAQMTMEEKAGLLFQTMAPLGGSNIRIGVAPVEELIADHALTHFNVFGTAPAREMALWQNRLQELAEQTRLGIPVTISSDPRHAFSSNPGAGMDAGSFSQWPEPLGFAAIGDPQVVEEFANIARQEYLATGIRVALHPMADLSTEPRWARIYGTFGEDAHLAARLVAAYIRGFQGETLGPASVACMTKHFPGGGPQQDGEDPHFSYGREQVYPGHNFRYHLIPFEAAFAAGTAQIMPYYGMPVGTEFEPVGFGFNRGIITGLLREHYGFDGVVCTDWGLLTDSVAGDLRLEARAWGVEHLSLAERAGKALEAGVDQFGGESCPEIVVALVRDGFIPEARIDRSARRLLREKFRLGLFDAPYVDPETAESVVGAEPFRQAGERAQRRSLVLLKNARGGNAPILPLRGHPRIYVENIDRAIASRYGEVVADAAGAEVAILRLRAPYEPRNTRFLESHFHAGDLRFPQDELGRILQIAGTVPTVIVLYLDRPAVVPELAQQCAALLAEFGAGDQPVLDTLFGQSQPAGRLPFELPASMEAVRRQKPDVPYDSGDPLFPFGHGLFY